MYAHHFGTKLIITAETNSDFHWTSHEGSLIHNSSLCIDLHDGWAVWTSQAECICCNWELISLWLFLSLGWGRLFDEFSEREAETFVGYHLDIVLVSMKRPDFTREVTASELQIESWPTSKLGHMTPPSRKCRLLLRVDFQRVVSVSWSGKIAWRILWGGGQNICGISFGHRSHQYEGTGTGRPERWKHSWKH